MLTSDLVRARTKAGVLLPRYVLPKDAPRLAPLAQALVTTFAGTTGAPKAELDEAVLAIPHEPRDRVVFLGLRKLCEDRLELADGGELDAVTVREAVFRHAAAAHRQGSFDRSAVLVNAAAELRSTAEVIERSLFADLREAQVVQRWEPIDAANLVASYNLALVQAVLLRATRLTIRSKDARVGVWRAVFRNLRFHGLLHSIEERAEGGYDVTIDGPFSIFDSIQKYGLRLGLFLKTALRLTPADIQAEVLWGNEKARVRFDVPSGAELVLGDAAEEEAPRPELTALVESFSALGSKWKVEPCERIFRATSGAAVLPDLRFQHTTGKEVYLELFGFWSRQGIFTRIEQITAGGLPPLILVAGKHLRVSEDMLDETKVESSLYMFKTAISAKEVERRLEAARLASPAPASKGAGATARSRKKTVRS